MNCKVYIWDFGCGCNRGIPVRGRCLMPRRRSEMGAPARIEQMKAEIEANGGEPIEEIKEAPDMHELFVKERALNNFQDTQAFCVFAKREKVCEEMCDVVVADEVL